MQEPQIQIASSNDSLFFHRLSCRRINSKPSPKALPWLNGNAEKAISNLGKISG
jgi:hypothetical protein